MTTAEQFREIMARLQTVADEYLAAEAELAQVTKELEAGLDEADLAAEASRDPQLMAELQTFTRAFRAARDGQADEVATDWTAELRAFAGAYQAAEVNGVPVQSISHAGWRPGARIGAHTAVAQSILLARHETGGGATLIFEEGHLDSFACGGLGGDFTARPFAIKTVIDSGLCGVLAPGAERLELISENGTVFPADVVAHTFAVTIDLPSERRLNRLRRAYATPDDQVPLMFDSDCRGENDETLDHFTVRVYGSNHTLMYTGPVLADQF